MQNLFDKFLMSRNTLRFSRSNDTKQDLEVIVENYYLMIVQYCHNSLKKQYINIKVQTKIYIFMFNRNKTQRSQRATHELVKVRGVEVYLIFLFLVLSANYLFSMFQSSGHSFKIFKVTLLTNFNPTSTKRGAYFSKPFAKEVL